MWGWIVIRGIVTLGRTATYQNVSFVRYELFARIKWYLIFIQQCPSVVIFGRFIILTSLTIQNTKLNEISHVVGKRCCVCVDYVKQVFFCRLWIVDPPPTTPPILFPLVFALLMECFWGRRNWLWALDALAHTHVTKLIVDSRSSPHILID